MIGIILAAAALMAVIYLAILNWEKILDWFHGRTELKESDKENIAFTLQEKLANGHYSTVQGIFNKRKSEVLDGAKYESENLDEKTEEAHRKEPLVIYE